MPARRNRGKSKVGNDYGSSSRAAARAAAEPAADERAEPAVEQRDDEGARRLDDFLTLSGRFSVAGFGRVRLDARTCACGSQGRLAFGVSLDSDFSLDIHTTVSNDARKIYDPLC